MGVRFLLQIVDAQTKQVVKLTAGGRLERDLLTDCTAAIVKRGVGLFRTEAHVAKDIQDGLEEVFSQLKYETRPYA